MSPTPPVIFNEQSRQNRMARARQSSPSHLFIHEKVAADIVDRLESILRAFSPCLFIGPGAKLIERLLTSSADAHDICVIDPLSPDTNSDSPLHTAFPDDHFELVVSFMELHAINNIPQRLAEYRRLLRQDGLLIAAFPGEETLTELRQSLQHAEVNVTGGVSPHVFPMIAVKDAGALLQAAGFALPVADIGRQKIGYGAFYSLIADLRGTGETNCLAEAKKTGLRREVLSALIASYGERFADPDTDDLLATVDIVTITGWKPHPKQPQPKKPGSARMNLKDAIAQSTD